MVDVCGESEPGDLLSRSRNDCEGFKTMLLIWMGPWLFQASKRTSTVEPGLVFP